MFTVYVLRSLRSGKRYVGFTSRPIEQRLKEHNEPRPKWTGQNGPFEILHSEIFPTKELAAKREKFLKTGRGRAVLDNILRPKG